MVEQVPEPAVGDVVKIKSQHQVYEGVLMEVGILRAMRSKEEVFLRGEYTPFSCKGGETVVPKGAKKSKVDNKNVTSQRSGRGCGRGRGSTSRGTSRRGRGRGGVSRGRDGRGTRSNGMYTYMYAVYYVYTRITSNLMNTRKIIILANVHYN